MLDTDGSIPQSLINDAEGIIIIPNAFKVALGWGGQGGRGIAIIHREDGTWSNPVFVTLGEGSLGFQAGAESSDIILLFKDRDQILKLEKSEITIGVDVTAVAGPSSANIHASTDIKFDADIYTYSRSKGLFAGVNVKGGVMKSNDSLNEAFYAQDQVDFDEIFNKLDFPFNKEIGQFIQSIDNYGKIDNSIVSIFTTQPGD